MGLTQTDLGKLVNLSKTAVSTREHGEVTMELAEIELFDDKLDANGMLVDIWTLAQLGSVSSAAMADMETGALVIQDWDARAIPGLLQTPEYTLAVMRAARIAADQAEREVATRTQRQKILESPDLVAAWFVIAESVLHLAYPGRAAMRDQLAHLEKIAELPNVFIQVMPHTSVRHPGSEGPLRIIQYGNKLPVWYTEGWFSGRLAADRTEVAEMMVNFDLIRASALPPEQSIAHIGTVRGTYDE